ncbi:MAG: hypothetical protein RIT45_3970 [Pseudomonadota bacterium]
MGDGRAFAELVRPHVAMLLRVAARAARDPGIAEDAVQEALDIAARELDRYQPGTSVRAWLARITATRAMTLVRGESRRRIREEVAEAPAAIATPDAVLQARQLADRIDAVLQALPEKRRIAAMLRLDGGMDYAEIAEAIDSTEASARALVHLAVKALREGLAEETR